MTADATREQRDQRRLLDLLRCTECGCPGALSASACGLQCHHCGHVYEVFEGVAVMRRGYELKAALEAIRHGPASSRFADRQARAGGILSWRRRRLEAMQRSLGGMRAKQFSRLRDTVIRKVARRPVEVAIEIGAGSFAQAVELAKTSELVLATEYDVASRSRGKTIALPESVLPICADARELPIRAGVADLLFSSNVLEHIPDAERALSEGKRCLANGGIMVHIVPTTACRIRTALTGPLSAILSADASPSRLWQRTFAVHGAVARSYLGELRLYSVARWRAFFRNAGLSIIAEEPMIGFWSANYDVDWAAAPLFWLGRSEHCFVVA